jgi:hypothetical protein
MKRAATIKGSAVTYSFSKGKDGEIKRWMTLRSKFLKPYNGRVVIGAYFATKDKNDNVLQVLLILGSHGTKKISKERVYLSEEIEYFVTQGLISSLDHKQKWRAHISIGEIDKDGEPVITPITPSRE